MYATKVAQIGTSHLFFREATKSIASIAGYPQSHFSIPSGFFVSLLFLSYTLTWREALNDLIVRSNNTTH